MKLDGLGVFNPKSAKQKINTKSSTEAETVGSSDYLPMTIWTVRFLKFQGVTVTYNIYYQDKFFWITRLKRLFKMIFS